MCREAVDLARKEEEDRAEGMMMVMVTGQGRHDVQGHEANPASSSL